MQRDVKEVGNCYLSHRCSAVGRYVGYDNAVAAGIIGIDYVVARSQYANVLEPGQRCHQLCVNYNLVRQQDFSIARSGECLLWGSSVVDLYLYGLSVGARKLLPRCPVDIAGVCGVSI